MSVLAVIPCLHCAIQPHQEKSWSCCPQPNAVNTSNLGMVSIQPMNLSFMALGLSPLAPIFTFFGAQGSYESAGCPHPPCPRPPLACPVQHICRSPPDTNPPSRSCSLYPLRGDQHRQNMTTGDQWTRNSRKTKKNVDLYHPKKWWFRVAINIYIYKPYATSRDIVISSVSPWRAGSLPNGTRGPSFRPRSTTSSCERHKNTSCLTRATATGHGHGHGPRPRARSNVHDGCTYVHMYIIIYMYGWMDGCMHVLYLYLPLYLPMYLHLHLYLYVYCIVLYCIVLYCIACMHDVCTYVRMYATGVCNVMYVYCT